MAQCNICSRVLTKENKGDGDLCVNCEINMRNDKNAKKPRRNRKNLDRGTRK